ncbi:MerR family transcriptional regulator [Rhodococcus sp. NPDC058532]|uniref:MerR family transcriptional regulator n=1 Tax=Rhodococcus sp. NPDC058532 TaxID=3346540 RepID=UPI003650932F
MRIGQLAAVAGTTTRTVRHYHRLGLLEEPQRRSNGYREYTIDDAVRLMRIRWLAAGGVPLGSIAAILTDGKTDDDVRDVVADLRALVSAIETQQAELARRRAQLTDMLAEAERGNPISVLPAGLTAVVSAVIDNTPSTAVGSALRRDRDLVEALVMSGKAPEGFLAVYETTMADDEHRARYLAVLDEWSNLEGRAPRLVEKDIAAVTDLLLEFVDSQQVPIGTSRLATTTNASAGAALQLDDVIPDEAQREVVRRVQQELSTRVSTPRQAR